MEELFLLGAGASVEAGVPDSYDMAKRMLEKFSNDNRARSLRYYQVLQFVVGGLLFQQGIKGHNPFDGVNIEDLFNAVLLLSDRQNSELSPFISSWHPKLIGLESGKMDDLTSEGLLGTINRPIEEYVKKVAERIIEQIRNDTFIGSRHFWQLDKIETFHSKQPFENNFTSAVSQIISGSEGKIFSATADAMIQHLVEMVWISEEEKVAYLRPLISYAKNMRSSIVTLNYDNTIEFTGKNLGISIDTGFDIWSRTGEFTFDDGKIPLIKLHGSIDWALTRGRGGKEKPLPYQIIKKVDPNVMEQRNFQPAVIFGGKNKLTAKGPFLSLLHSFEAELSNCITLTIIGYSFRDEHVNEFITNWFNGDNTRRIRIINPNPDTLNNDFSDYLFKETIKNRVEVIQENTSNGILKITEGK